MKWVKYNKVGWYLVIKFLSRTGYKNDNAVLTVDKLKLSIKGYSSSWKHVHWKLWIYLHLQKKPLVESFIFYAQTFLLILHSKLCSLDVIRFLCTLCYGVSIKLIDKVYLLEDMPKKSLGGYYHFDKRDVQLQCCFG